jgi:hypothetical protein
MARDPGLQGSRERLGLQGYVLYRERLRLEKERLGLKGSSARLTPRPWGQGYPGSRARGLESSTSGHVGPSPSTCGGIHVDVL